MSHDPIPPEDEEIAHKIIGALILLRALCGLCGKNSCPMSHTF